MSQLGDLAEITTYTSSLCMSQSASKRRICSYDMLEVRPDVYTLTEKGISKMVRGERTR